jgi:hypothetical protein
MSALTGVAATGVARRSNIACVDADASRKYTTNSVYYVKTLADGVRSIIVPDMPAGSNGTGPYVYAALLKAAGARQYVEPGSYIRRHGDVYMYHTGTAGTHTITLPNDVAKVRELFTGEEFDSNVVTVEADGPATWLFRATTGDIWTVGDDVIAVLDADGTLHIDGTGPTADFADASDVPWDPTQVQSVVVGDGVTLGANALAALSDETTVNGIPLRMLRSGLGGGVPDGMVLVSRTELDAPGIATLEVSGGTALLGIGVCTNADLRTEPRTWEPVVFRKSDLDVSEDGTRILAPVPANADRGFMILRSGSR